MKKVKKTSAIYAGKRSSLKGVPHQLFIWKRKECWFRGIHGVSIGARYEATEEKGKIRMQFLPTEVAEYDKWNATDAEKVRVREWEAADKAAEQLARQRRSASASKRYPEFIKDLPERLGPYVRELSYEEIKALSEWLALQLWKGKIR